MAQSDRNSKLVVNGLFKNNKEFELCVRRYCQSKGKSSIQLMNGRGVIKLICAYQMKEIRRVRKFRTGKSKPDQIKPEIKCRACFKAVMRSRIETTSRAKTGVKKFDERKVYATAYFSY